MVLLKHILQIKILRKKLHFIKKKAANGKPFRNLMGL